MLGVLCRVPGPPGIDIDLRVVVEGDPLAREYGEQLAPQWSWAG